MILFLCVVIGLSGADYRVEPCVFSQVREVLWLAEQPSEVLDALLGSIRRGWGSLWPISEMSWCLGYTTECYVFRGYKNNYRGWLFDRLRRAE